MTEVDLSRLPWWAVIVLQLIILFKAQLGTLIVGGRDYVRHRVRRQTDREKFERELVRDQLDREYQIESAEVVVDQGREMRLLELLEKKDAWVQNTLTKEISCLQDGQNRTNDLLGQIHTVLVEMKAQRGAAGRD
jgi:hypothetical protein